MKAAPWTKQLPTLIKSLSSATDLPTFRTEYEQIIATGTRSGDLAQETANLLGEALGYIEQWTGDPPPSPAQVWKQAIFLHDASIAHKLPSRVTESLLGHFPKGSTNEQLVTDLVLGEVRKDWLTFLVAKKLVRLTTLAKIARKEPSRFYRSVGLDVLVERGGRCPRTIWNEMAVAEARPKGLMPPEKAIVRALASDSNADAPSWLTTFLEHTPRVRTRILLALLDDVAQCQRMVAFLCGATSNPKRAKRAGASVPIDDIVGEWITHCLDEAERDGPVASLAKHALAMFELTADLMPDGHIAKRMALHSARLSALREQDVLFILQVLEGSEGPSGPAKRLVVAKGRELYQAIQRYVRQLPVADDSAAGSPERASRIARYEGQRDLAVNILSALNESSDPSPLKDALEVALYNVGVRSFGAPGELVKADIREHELTSSGMFPGDTALVVQPGRRLGDQDGVVLVRAKVRLPEPS